MFITVRKITNKLDIAQIKDLFKSNIMPSRKSYLQVSFLYIWKRTNDYTANLTEWALVNSKKSKAI